MLVAKTSVLLENIRQNLPVHYSQLQAAAALSRNGGKQALESAYSHLDSISFDKGVLEKSTNLRVVPCCFSWSDVGSLDSLDQVLPGDENGNASLGEHFLMDCENCIIHNSTGMVAAVVAAPCPPILPYMHLYSYPEICPQ